jgi:site-specific recombinase XerD
MSTKTFERIMKETEENIQQFLDSDLYKGVKEVSSDDASAMIKDFTKAIFEKDARTPKKWTGAATSEVLTEMNSENTTFSSVVWNKIVPALSAYVRFINDKGYIKNGATIIKAIEKNVETLANNAPTQEILVTNTSTTSAFADWPTPQKRVPMYIVERNEKKKANKINKFLKNRKKK